MGTSHRRQLRTFTDRPLPLTFISNYLVLEEGAFYYLALA